MLNTKTAGHVSTALSIAGAIGILAVLLLIATAPTPDRYRNLAGHTSYIASAINGVANGMAVSNAQAQALGEKVAQLDTALVQGTELLSSEIDALYAPAETLDTLRWPLMEWLNVIDQRTTALNEPVAMLATRDSLVTGIERMRTQLAEFGAAQRELSSTLAGFNENVNTVVSGFRGRGLQRTADAVYINTQQIRRSLVVGSQKEMDRILVVIDQLEVEEAALKPEERANVRLLINTTYTMISLRRAMKQAELLMDTKAVGTSLDELTSGATQDQLYVLSAVGDARVLLNVYTVLLLAVLAFFGLRLRASHRALNRSHDDLEERVEARTADLEKANEHLKESQVQLVQAEKMSSLGQLVAGVMHEINTPLLYVLNNTTVTAEAVNDLSDFVEATLPILTAADADAGREALKRLLSRKNEFDVEELREGIEEAQSLVGDSVDGLNQISELVQSLKDFSRLDRVADDKFDVREGIEKTLTMTRNMLKYGIDVQRDFQEVPEIYCSPSRLNQVFINIVTNAVQAMDGEGTLKISTNHVQSSQGESVEIVFEDTGCGIPEEHLGKIMDPFYTTKPVGQGTGLGLSIVAQIVDQHGGTIFIDSKQDLGTRIVLSFPVSDEPPALVHSDEEEAA